LENALGKAAKSPLFPINLRLLSQKLKFWESLNFIAILTDLFGNPVDYRTSLMFQEKGIAVPAFAEMKSLPPS
jgi:hypothetical protein